LGDSWKILRRRCSGAQQFSKQRFNLCAGQSATRMSEESTNALLNVHQVGAGSMRHFKEPQKSVALDSIVGGELSQRPVPRQ